MKIHLPARQDLSDNPHSVFDLSPYVSFIYSVSFLINTCCSGNQKPSAIAIADLYCTAERATVT